ncbi:unnamed protein product [Spirodela intermedia]|uniref:Uncharacterized protein n=1 Tax=Spirodela intermedia TaxID=51605 RepID=A0A7I8KG42_SPIIN|nr:unnamed protein product [Spirodela intermedia]
MRPVLRDKADKGEVEPFISSPRKDWSFRLIKVVIFLIIFTAGVVLGLSASAHFTQYLSHTEVLFPSAPYMPNDDMDFVGIKNYIEPKWLQHNMTDHELFWRASMVPTKTQFPYKRVPRVAFLFLTRGDLPLAPLWERFFHGHKDHFSVYVHSPPDHKLNVSKTSPFYGRQIPSQGVQWGSISLLDAEKRLLANALLDFSNERFILLSESCIPIFNFPTVYQYLTSSKHSFVESFDEHTPRGRGRYRRQMAPQIKLYHWRKGSEWFELNRKLAVNIVADVTYYSIFMKHCKPSCYPDEHFMPTFINMFHGALNSNRTITWVDWSTRGPHPALFGRGDITVNFIQSIRDNGTVCTHNSKPTSVCFLFARKFAPSTLEALLNISSTVLKF